MYPVNILTNLVAQVRLMIDNNGENNTFWPKSSNHNSHKTYQSNVDKLFDPRTRRKEKNHLDRQKIFQKRDKEKLKLQHLIYGVLYENLNFRAELEKIKIDLNINPQLDIQNIHFLGKDGLVQEREVKKRVSNLQTKYLALDYLTNREFNLQLARIDLEIASDFFNLSFYSDCWHILARVHYFLKSQAGYKGEEILEYLKASYHILFQLWRSRSIQLNLLTLQDLAYYCLEEGLVYDSVQVLNEILQMQVSSVSDLGWTWSMLGRAKSNLPKPNSQEIIYFFQKSLECNAKIIDPLVRLQKESEIHTNQGFALYNCGLLHEAEYSFEEARENMQIAMEMNPQYWSQEVYDQKTSEILISQAQIMVERLKNTGSVDQTQYHQIFGMLVDGVNVFERLKIDEWKSRSIQLIQEFKQVCEQCNPLMSLKVQSLLNKYGRSTESSGYMSPKLAKLNYSM